MFRQTGLRPEMLPSLFWFHYKVWKCKLLLSIMTLLADVTSFMFICNVLKTFRSSLYKRKTFMHAYQCVLLGKTGVLIAVNTMLKPNA